MTTTRLPPPPLAPWDERLHALLRSHVVIEGAMLGRYAAIADQTESKAFGYLVNLLLEDERRHHRLFEDLADALETGALMRREEPAVPHLDFHRADRAAILGGAKELLENEKQDLDELKYLQRELRDVKDTTLWSLLVELMQRDTEKHIAILKFVCRHA